MANDRGTLVDSNVLIDLAIGDVTWVEWSAAALADAFERGPVVVNPIIYAEVSTRYDRIEAVDAVLPETSFRRERLPFQAGFLAGKAFVDYRRRGGTRRSPLPDFYIGAHAAVRRHRLVTRDAGRYRSYFPTVEIVSPD